MIFFLELKEDLLEDSPWVAPQTKLVIELMEKSWMLIGEDCR